MTHLVWLYSRTPETGSPCSLVHPPVGVLVRGRRQRQLTQWKNTTATIAALLTEARRHAHYGRRERCSADL